MEKNKNRHRSKIVSVTDEHAKKRGRAGLREGQAGSQGPCEEVTRATLDDAQGNVPRAVACAWDLGDKAESAT